MSEQVGPSKVVKIEHHCTGCKFLETKEWSFMGENDDLDSGTDAKCNAKNGIHISSYYHDNHTSTPIWCPYLEKKTDG